MIKTLSQMALVGGLLMVTACATTLEPDGRLDTARDRVNAASAYGTDSTAYTTAARYLGEAEEAFEEGDARAYDKSVDLGDAFAQVAIAEGEAGEAMAAADGLRAELSSAEAGVAQCQADISQCRATNAALEANMSGTLDLLTGAMRCTRSDGGDGTAMLTCPGLSFGFDQARLNAATDARLTALSEFLKANPGVSASLIGHTDATGDEAWNMALSQRRAETTAQFLVAEGVDAARITTSGRGEAEPVAANDTRAGRAQNRRVDVMLSGLATASTMGSDM